MGLITYTNFIQSIATLGAIILLFVVGLEFKLKEIFNIKYGVIAVVGVIVPWIGGYYVSKLFGYDFISAIFVGTALTATSIAITANVLREMGKLHTDTAKAIIGAAVIDDILGLLALSFSEQIVSGTLSVSHITLVFLKATAFLLIAGFIGYKYLNKIVKKIDETKMGKTYPEIIFIFTMMIAFLYAMLAQSVGLSGIVGAFLAGVCFENVIIRHGKNHKEGAEYLYIIFASIFFVSLGIIADFHALTLSVLWFLIALIIVAVLTKVVGCYIPAKLQGMTHKDALIVGFGMSPRGEVAMIVALIGLTQGLIKQDIYVSLVLMSLITTMITPLVLRNVFYRKETLKL